MKITALVENQSNCNLKSIHGLSLYIETQKHKLLFDLGPDQTLFENARKKGIHLKEIDTVVISHGHMDHGGALGRFLEINHKAKIYMQRKALEPHYAKVFCFRIPVGLNSKWKESGQLVLLDGDYTIDEELQLFVVPETKKLYSAVNDKLYTKNGRDDFLHEHNLLIREKKNVLIMGCGHAGVVNILEKIRDEKLEYCIGGYHMTNPATRKMVPESLLDGIATELNKYTGMNFYTCHCTGKRAYEYLKSRVTDMNYLACGDTLTIGECI
ncbi:MAG: MBL fold metallo-hydrolase [Lachnospiraceae bacterium]|nr:MBL fold metallo-hydrolase [Lachnospiraceae bacterium]